MGACGFEKGEELTDAVTTFCFLGFLGSRLLLIWPLAIAFLHHLLQDGDSSSLERLSTDSAEMSAQWDTQSLAADDGGARASVPRHIHAS